MNINLDLFVAALQAGQQQLGRDACVCFKDLIGILEIVKENQAKLGLGGATGFDRIVTGLLARIDELETAIQTHRDHVHGPDYDYAGDPAYQAEAALYQALGNTSAR